jgi:hypothetical protein
MANQNATEWALKGIRYEISRTTTYLQSLKQQESELVGANRGGTNAGPVAGQSTPRPAGRGPGRPKGTSAASRKGSKLSEATREKMRQAQRARHASKNGGVANTGETVTSIPQPDTTGFSLPETVQ